MNSIYFQRSILCLILLSRFSFSPAAVDSDVLLIHGSLHLGDGQPAITGKVAIKDGVVQAVGDFETGKTKQIVDCRGLVVCPGFIDLHNHSDDSILNANTRTAVNYVTQGCTTIITGNCGSGPIQVKDYYEKIDKFGAGLNVGHLLPQGNLRKRVIQNENRRATSDEIQRMKTLTETAMRQGAWGMSTGLIYVPSSYASTEELIELSKVVGRFGGIYVSHIRNENVELLDAVQEALRIGREASLPVHISHFKSSGKNSWGLVRTAVEIIKQAQSAHQIVTADQYPYTASSTSIDATLLPAWARAGGRQQMLARLKQPGESEKVWNQVRQKLKELDQGQRLQISYYSLRPDWSGLRISEIAKIEKRSVLSLITEILQNGGASVVNHSINEEDVRFVMQLPWVATASDGGAKLPGPNVPHPRNYGTFPRKIGYYCHAEKVVDLPNAIRSATGLPADILRMEDRGYLKVGYAADVVVFDPAKIRDNATFAKPHQYSQGIQHVLVNGKFAMWNGSPTGALVGKALRRKIE